jgi:hypothetical protein
MGSQPPLVPKASFQSLSFLFGIDVAGACGTERIAPQASDPARSVPTELVLGWPAQEGLILVQPFRFFVITSFLLMRLFVLLLLSSFPFDGLLGHFRNAFCHE